MLGKSSGAFLWGQRLLKLASIVVGGPVAVLCLAGWFGTFIDHHWGSFGAALAVGIAVPLFIADRLLPDDPDKGRGIVTDVLAVLWVGIALVTVLVAGGANGVLAKEGERLAEAGWSSMSDVAFFMAGPTIPFEDVPTDLIAVAEGTGQAAEGSGSEATADTRVVPTPPLAYEQPESVEGDEERTYTPAEIFAQWAPSVVSIQTNIGGGTGFIITGDGLVVTNHHVIERADSIQVKLFDNSWASEVWLLAEDAARDLALLRITVSDRELGSVRLGDSDEVVVGEQAVAIGNPLGLEHTLTDGLISSRRVYEGQHYLQISVPISPGNSGGPVFNMQGAVIGISTAAFRRGQNLNLAVPVNDLDLVLAEEYPDQRHVGGGLNTTGSW